MSYPVHSGMASSFADPADVVAFKKCKLDGGYHSKGIWYPGSSDEHCFQVGDNGIGCWLDDTTVDEPYCALSPTLWETFKHPHGQKILVTINGYGVVCKLMDTLPRFPKHGVIVDLNPGAQKAFSLRPPFLIPATVQVVT